MGGFPEFFSAICHKLSCLSSICIGSRHIGQYLLSTGMSSKPFLIELLWCLVTQGLMRPHPLVDPVPGQKGSPKPAYIRGQLLYLIELFLVSAEGSLYPTITLRGV